MFEVRTSGEVTGAAERNFLYQTVRKLSATRTVDPRVALSMVGVETLRNTARVADVSTTNEKVCPSIALIRCGGAQPEKN